MSLLGGAANSLTGDIFKGPKPISVSDNVITPQEKQFSDSVQSNLTKTPEQVSAELSHGVSQDVVPQVKAQVEQKSTALGMNTPEDYSNVLSKMAQTKVDDATNRIKSQNDLRAQRMSDNNLKTAFSNAMNTNEFGREAQRRRMERSQARYAARMQAIGSVLQVGGMVAGTALGNPGMGAAAGKALSPNADMPQSPQDSGSFLTSPSRRGIRD